MHHHVIDGGLEIRLLQVRQASPLGDENANGYCHQLYCGILCTHSAELNFGRQERTHHPLHHQISIFRNSNTTVANLAIVVRYLVLLALLVEAREVPHVFLLEVDEVPQLLLVEAEEVEEAEEVKGVEEAELLLLVDTHVIDGKRISNTVANLATVVQYLALLSLLVEVGKVPHVLLLEADEVPQLLLAEAGRAPQDLLVYAERALQVLLVNAKTVPRIFLVEAEQIEKAEDVKEVGEVESLLVIDTAMIDGKRVLNTYKHLAPSGTLLFYCIDPLSCSCHGATPSLSCGMPSSGRYA